MTNLITQLEAMAAGIEALTPYAVQDRVPLNNAFLQQRPTSNEAGYHAQEFRNFWFELAASVILNTEVSGTTRFAYRSTVTLNVVHPRFASTRIDRAANSDLQATYIMKDAQQLCQYIVTESTRANCNVHHIGEPEATVQQVNDEDRLLVITFTIEHEET